MQGPSSFDTVREIDVIGSDIMNDLDAAPQKTQLTWKDLILANLNEGVFVISDDGTIMFANDAFAEMIDKPRGQIVGKLAWSVFSLMEKPDQQNAGSRKLLSASSVANLVGVHQLDTKAGLITLEIDVIRIPKLEQIVFVARDITEETISQNKLENRKIQLEKVNKRLQESKKRVVEEKANIEAVISSIGEGLIATDQNGLIVRVNRAAEQLIGWNESEIIGKDLRETIPCLDDKSRSLPASSRIINIALATKMRVENHSYFYVRKDGSRFPVAITATPITSRGVTTGAIEIIRDITEEKMVDNAKSEFVSLASHQLRTPLSSINWYTEMLLSGDAGKINREQKQYLEEIYQGNRMMLDLIGSLLNVSRLELGNFVIEPQPLKITSVVKSVLAELAPLSRAKKLKIMEQYGSIPMINFDKRLIRIVFQNIISNSIKYTPEHGDITIDIAIHAVADKNRERDGEGNLLIQITDTGVGIPELEQAEIYTKLFRADNVRELETEGTGLGLYIVKSIVDQSGGEIWFQSEENKGTTFFVAFPLSGMQKKEGTKRLG